MLHQGVYGLQKHRGWRGQRQSVRKLRERVLVMQPGHQVELCNYHRALLLEPTLLVCDIESLFTRRKDQVGVKELRSGQKRLAIFADALHRLGEPEPAFTTRRKPGKWQGAGIGDGDGASGFPQ